MKWNTIFLGLAAVTSDAGLPFSRHIPKKSVHILKISLHMHASYALEEKYLMPQNNSLVLCCIKL